MRESWAGVWLSRPTQVKRRKREKEDYSSDLG